LPTATLAGSSASTSCAWSKKRSHAAGAPKSAGARPAQDVSPASSTASKSMRPRPCCTPEAASSRSRSQSRSASADVPTPAASSSAASGAPKPGATNERSRLSCSSLPTR